MKNQVDDEKVADSRSRSMSCYIARDWNCPMLTPYFQNEQIIIYYGDCREIIPSLATDSVDLIITDPPYGINYQTTGTRKRPLVTCGIANDDGKFDVILCLALSLRLLRSRRHFYTFGQFDLTELPKVGGITELIWDKTIIGSGDVSSVWAKSHEYLQFAVNHKRNCLPNEGHGNVAGRLRRGSVLRFQRLQSSANARHPTEKPLPLLRELIESSSHMSETVLDIFAGSGSTLYAAWLEGRKAIGIEIDERYCEIAARRFQSMPLLCEAI